MLFAYFCLFTFEYTFKVIIKGPTSIPFTYVDPSGETTSVNSLSSTSKKTISYTSNNPFTFTFKFSGCTFTQSGEITTNTIIPEVNNDYLKNICNTRTFPKMLDKTYLKFKNEIEYSDVQLFYLFNNEYKELKKGNVGSLYSTESYFETNFYVKSSICTSYEKLGYLRSNFDKDYMYHLTNNKVPSKCINSGDGGDTSKTYYINIVNQISSSDYQLFARNQNGQYIEFSKDYKETRNNPFSITVYIESSACPVYTSAKTFAATTSETISYFRESDIPSKCVPSGGGSSGSCSSDGKTYTIDGQMNVIVQSVFQNECRDAENLIITGAKTITFQSGDAFKNSKLKKIQMLASSSITLQHDSFEGITTLDYLSLSSDFVTIQGTTFKGSGLSTVSIKGTSAVTIQDTAFKDCAFLSKVTLTGSSVTVQGLTFSHCTKLNSFTIQASSTAIIQSNAFCGCDNLNRENININAPIINWDIVDAFKCNEEEEDEEDKEDYSPKESGSGSSGSDNDSGSSAKTLGNIEIRSAYLGTTPNIVVNLRFLYSFMNKMRNAFGHVIPSPEIVHSAIWVGESNPTDESVGALFTYGRYPNKNNNQAFLWNDGAKGYTLTFKEFKKKFNAAEPKKLKLHKNIKLFDFIDQIKENGNWGYKDYNWPTNNCQHFTSKLINILDATRDSPNNNDWTELPKLVLDSLKSNEEKHN